VRRRLPLGRPDRPSGGADASGAEGSWAEGSWADGSWADGSWADGSWADGSWAEADRSRAGWGGEGILVRVGDARAVLEKAPAGSFDVLVADVFAGGTTPAHVTSLEFTVAAAAALAPSGVYAVNIGDGPPLAHARARVAAARAVFAHACVIAEAAVLRGRRFGNLVLAAADHELPVAVLTRRAAADPFPARLLDGAALDRFVDGSPPITDADAEPSPTPPPGAFA